MVAVAGGCARTVIGVEIAGVLLTGTVSPSGGGPADLFGLATLGGAALSLAAAVGLLRPGARRYVAAPGTSDAGFGTSPHPDASHWRLVPV